MGAKGGCPAKTAIAPAVVDYSVATPTPAPGMGNSGEHCDMQERITGLETYGEYGNPHCSRKEVSAVDG